MVVKVRRMTLREVLARYHITTLREFCSRTGFTRQHAWNLMNGWTGVGKQTMQTLHDRLHIPFEELMQIRPVPRTARRRRVPPPDEHTDGA
jgi:hypothetical protein